MQNIRKTASLLLVLCLLLGSLPVLGADYVTTHFISDVLNRHVTEGRRYETSHGGYEGPSAFVNITWLEIFGYGLGSSYATRLIPDQGMELSQFVRKEARPGDILVFTGNHALLVAEASRNLLVSYETPVNFTEVDNIVTKVDRNYDELTAQFGDEFYLLQMSDAIYDYVDNQYDGLTAPALDRAGQAETDVTAAKLTVRVRTLPNLAVDQLGVELWTQSGQVVSTGYAKAASGLSGGGFYYQAAFDTKADMGLTLEAEATYKYRFFATIGGAYYYSSQYEFTTAADPNEPIKHTITLDANGGKVSPTTVTATRNAAIGQLPTPTRDGYTFAGWFTRTEGGQKITAGNQYDWEQDITLYAQWSRTGVTLYFNPGAGTVSPESMQVAVGQRVGDLPVPVLKGATFAGWYTAASGGNRVTSRTTFNAEGAVTLYARWSDETITVKFNANKGSVYPDSIEVNPEGRFGQLPTPTRSGYKFTGWYTEKRGGYKVSAGDMVWFDRDFTLYAHWDCQHNYRNGKCTQCGDYDRSYSHHKHQWGMHNFNFRRSSHSHSFKDVPSSAWFYDTVSQAYALGLIDGMSLATFEPDGILTYAQAIKLAAGLHNIYYNGSTDFAQTSPWYWAYVDYAVDNGILDDHDFTDFNAAITRAEFVAMLAAALPNEALEQINQVADYSLPDVEMDHAFAPFIYRLYRAGVLTGVDDYGTFMPSTSIKRCEVATIIARMADTGMRKSFRLY